MVTRDIRIVGFLISLNGLGCISSFLCKWPFQCFDFCCLAHGLLSNECMEEQFSIVDSLPKAIPVWKFFYIIPMPLFSSAIFYFYPLFIFWILSSSENMMTSRFLTPLRLKCFRSYLSFSFVFYLFSVFERVELIVSK